MVLCTGGPSDGFARGFYSFRFSRLHYPAAAREYLLFGSATADCLPCLASSTSTGFHLSETLFLFYSVLMKSNLQVFRLWHNFYAQSWILYLNFGHEKLVSNWKNNQVMTLFPRNINIDQLGVRSLFGCLFVYVTKEKAYNLVSFSARKMFLYFFLYRIQWGIQWNHQILPFITTLLRKRTKTNCNMLGNFENILKTKSLVSQSF